VNATIRFKHKLGNQFWVESAPFFNYYTRTGSYDVEFIPIVGYQASNRLSIEFLLGYSRYRTIFMYNYEIYGEVDFEKENYMVRILPQYSINRNWSIYLSPKLEIFPQFKYGNWSVISGAVLQW
jgi:hypothetical protein